MNSEINQRIGNEIEGLEQNIKNLNQELFHSQKELELLKKLNNSNTKAKIILNREEKQIHYILKTIISDNFCNKYELFSQIPFSAFIKIEGEMDFFYDYSRWYVDFLIAKQTMDVNGYYIFTRECVIEYYGTGHYGDEKNDYIRKSVERRDKIKQLFLEKMEIPILVIKNADNKTLASGCKAFNDLKAYLENFLKNSQKNLRTEIIL